MTSRDTSRNRALLRYILLPMIFLTVALLGGLRIDIETKSFIFIPPRLITLILSVFLIILFVRGHTIEIRKWIRSDQSPLTNISHVLTLLTLFFGSAQAFNSVMPERGFLFWMFSFFFLWTLWNNQFSNFDARLLLRSLSVLFGTAFFLKHMFLASVFSPEGGVAKEIASFFLELSTLGTIDTQTFAPATGYISFFTLALYFLGLMLLPPSPEPVEDARLLTGAQPPGTAAIQSSEALPSYDTVEITGEVVTEETKELKIKN